MPSRLAPIAARWARPAAVTAVVELITVGGSTGKHYAGHGVDALAVLLLVVAAGAVLTVRSWQWPSLTISVLATAAYFGLGYPTDSPFFVGALVTAYRSADTCARERAVFFTLATPTLFVAAATIGQPGYASLGIGESTLIVAGLLGGQAAAEWRARADRQTERVREEEALRQLAEERMRISRELHDVVSHSIAMINVRAGVALHVMDDQPDEARAALLAIKGASHDALRDLRSILGLLRETDEGDSRAPMAGLEQIPELADKVRGAGVMVAIDLQAGEPPLPVSIDLAAYRVIQEALTNVVRHAPGATATVTVRRRADGLLVRVEDDGRKVMGVETRRGAGHGLTGMRERVRAAGGTLETGTRPGGGYVVHASLPLETA